MKVILQKCEPKNFSSCRWGLACAEPEAKTPIGVSLDFSFSKFVFKLQKGFLPFLEEQQKRSGPATFAELV